MNEEKSLYEELGGEAGLRRLVDRFYELMDTLPQAKEVREMHPSDLTGSREKLFEFMSGWSGGPPLFHQKRGHPMLRRRHFPFSIGKLERDQWMMCMILALEDVGVDESIRLPLIETLYRLADHMRNRSELTED